MQYLAGNSERMRDDVTSRFSSMPLRDRAYHVLRHNILMGKIIPGEHLKEVALANEMSMSRTPIRKAMQMLEHDGLVYMTYRHGAVVADITEKELNDVFEIRKVFARIVIEQACRKMSKKDKQLLVMASEKFEQKASEDDVFALVSADEEFHHLINQKCANQCILQFFEYMQEKMFRYGLEYLKGTQFRMKQAEEHRQLTEYICTGKIREAQMTMCRHIENQRMSILAAIERRACV